MSDFNKLWLGQTISLLGSAVTMFALPTLAVLVLHATPVQLGALTALQTLPFPFLGMFVGVVADRVSRRRIMIVADIVRFVALASVPIAAGGGALGMPQLYGVAFMSGTASAFFGIAYQSYLPVIVPAKRLTDANAKLEFSNSGSAMAGIALAGVLVQWIGAALAIAADALSYIASVISLLTIRSAEEPHKGPPLSLRQAVHEINEGLKVVFRSNDLRWILYATATTNLGGAMIVAVFFIYAYRLLHLQPGLLGLVDGLANLGFVGALFAVRVRNRLGLRATLIASLLGAGLGSMCILLAGVAAPYVVLFAQGAAVAVAVPIYNINQVSYRQALIDARLQGRLNATMRTFVWGTVPLGSIIGGWLGALIGVPATIACGALVSCVAALWVLPLRVRELPYDSQTDVAHSRLADEQRDGHASDG
jgi:MFS family permease